MSQLTPKEIVEALDQHIIGQTNAKRAVAVALRNRWRRMQVPEGMQKEITPKNILMIGPTGVGKTEIARRLAKLANSPFIKVEATKFTEVGYVGKDVESIIRDLVETSVQMARANAMTEVRAKAEDAAIARVVDIMMPKRQSTGFGNAPEQADERGEQTRQKLLDRLLNGDFNDKEIEIDVQLNMGVEIMAPPGMEEMTSQLQSMFANFAGGKKQKQKLKVKDAIPVLIEEEAQRLINDEEVKQQALKMAEETGIVFIDEIDKVARRSDSSTSGEVSREGVQRDLLPLVEGCTVNTRYGAIKTDHILFIASGAFHVSKPSDLAPELQGRLPIRVELRALGVDDFKRILTEPSASLTSQYIALLATEGVELRFGEDAITRIAEIAYAVNESTENIGARRLHTLLEKLLEEISFGAADNAEKSIEITAAYVDEHLQALAEDEDLSRYIL